MNLKTFYKALNKLIDVFYKVIYNICYNTFIRAYIIFMDAVLLVLVVSCFVEPYRAFTNVRMR